MLRVRAEACQEGKLMLPVCFAAIAVIIPAFLCSLFSGFKRKPFHRRCRKQALQIYKKLHWFGKSSGGQIIGYLRKINPFVFEELVLLCFKKSGCKIYRNSRYTGDGGFDGKVRFKGHIWLLQDKRYEGYVNKKHLKDFNDLCFRKGVYGFFVHTGKTGGGALKTESDYPFVRIISGKKLVSLIIDNMVIGL